MIFVGGDAHSQQREEDVPFQAQVIEPDQQGRRERDALRQAISAKIEQLTQLMEQALAAGDPHSLQEAEFWRQELAQ